MMAIATLNFIKVMMIKKKKVKKKKKIIINNLALFPQIHIIQDLNLKVHKIKE